MARRAGKVFPSTNGYKQRACRLFEEEDLVPEERAYVTLLNLGLLKSIHSRSSRSLLGSLPQSGRGDDPAQRDVSGEQERNPPDDLLS